MVGSKNRKFSNMFLVGLTLFFLYLPIIVMIVFSFNDKRSLSVWGGFSLRWYQQIFKNRQIAEVVFNTILIAVIATVVSTFIGTITAIGLSKSNKIVRSVVTNVSNLPILNPDIVTAIGLMLLFSALNLPKGFWTMLLAHIVFCIPYVILAVMPKIRSLDENVAEAAMDLGATPYQALTKVIIPQIKPGIISGALIAFTMSFDDFVISYFVTGEGFKNISILVSTMGRRINPSINALSTIFVVIITIVLILINVVPVIAKKRKEQNYEKIN